MKTLKISKVLLPALFIFLFNSKNIIGQTTLVLQPDAATAKDAEIWSLSGDVNYGNWPEIKANAWTWSGIEGFQRALLDFDLTSIPADAVIISAKLSLYGVDAASTQYHSGDNDSWLKRIVEPWDENLVTWNNQPSTTDENQTQLLESVSSLQDYLNIDVTSMVIDMRNNPDSSFGFLMSLNTEDKYRRMTFLSSDQPDITRSPKLVIEYFQEQADQCIILQPGSDEGQDAELWNIESGTNYGDWPELKANAWTWGGIEGKQRAIFKFDLTTLPEGAIVDSATLSLYAVESPSDQYHYGANKSVIRRVTTNWNEYSVTWNSQPNTTALNQIILPNSTSAYQDYLNIDVTNLLNDMVADPTHSYGFMLRLGKERKYRRMTFASSDYSNPDRHPKLEICYHLGNDLGRISNFENTYVIFPNPFEDEINVQLKESYSSESVLIRIYNLNGQLLYNNVDIINGNIISIIPPDLKSGSYLFSITGKDLNFSQIIIKE